MWQGSCQEAAKLTPPALAWWWLAEGGAGPAAVWECGPDPPLHPTPPQHICTWFTVNESPVLMNQAWAPFPSCPGTGTQTQAPPYSALTGYHFSQLFLLPLEDSRGLDPETKNWSSETAAWGTDGNGEVNRVCVGGGMEKHPKGQ